MEKITNRAVVFIILILMTLSMGFVDNEWYHRLVVILIAVWWILFMFSKKYQNWQDLKFDWFKNIKNRNI